MAQPKIRGIDMSSIKSISTIDVEPAWTTRYEVDFVKEGTALSWDAKDAGDTAKRTLNGVQWEVRSVANASVILLDSDGLKITPTGGEMNWDGTTNLTGPRVFCRMSGTVSQVPIYPSIGFGQAIAVQCVVESSQDVAANFDGYGISLLDVSDAAPSILADRYYSSAATNRLLSLQGASYEDKVAGSQMKFYEIVYANGAMYANASTSSELLAPMTATGFRGAGSSLTDANVDPTSNPLDPRNAIVFLYGFRDGSSSTSFTPTFKKFRVLTMGEPGSI